MLKTTTYSPMLMCTSTLIGLVFLNASCRDDTVSKPKPEPVVIVSAPTSHPTDTPHAEPMPELVAIDIFGTRQITRAQLLSAVEKPLREFAAAPGNPQSLYVNKVHKLGDFAHVELSLITYYEPEGIKKYLTVDLVDRADAARRMPFLFTPMGSYEDPEGLLADWNSYEEIYRELISTNQISPIRNECPAFHCLGDHLHNELKPLAEKFVARVPAHFAELATILRDDSAGSRRAAAAFLLAYTRDGPALVKLMLPAFRDGSVQVRNNAMRVISDIAFYHPELQVPLDPVLNALEYPTTLDRNKAAAILTGLLERPNSVHLHKQIVKRSGATLLDMLRLTQPNNHYFAYRILKAISGESFGERDYAAWGAWMKMRRGKPTQKPTLNTHTN